MFSDIFKPLYLVDQFIVSECHYEKHRKIENNSQEAFKMKTNPVKW